MPRRFYATRHANISDGSEISTNTRRHVGNEERSHRQFWFREFGSNGLVEEHRSAASFPARRIRALISSPHFVLRVAFLQRVAVQAKHWQPEPPVDRAVVEQLVRGIEAEVADLGMVVTSGSISEDAYHAAQQYFDDRGTRIELVDGEQFATLIVEHGIGMKSSDENYKRSIDQRVRTIGILAYGSLIDDPGPEIGPLIRERLSGVMTPFCVEFARSSRTRDGGPTVIPVENGGASVAATILVLDSGVSADRAADLLSRRETRNDGAGRHYSRPDSPGINDTNVEHISDFNGVAEVLYTRVGSNITNLSAEVLAELAINSARRGAGKNGKDGINYLIGVTRHGISTPLAAAYERVILEKTGAQTLPEALARIQNLEGRGQKPRNTEVFD